jgi:hypothetical protein
MTPPALPLGKRYERASTPPTDARPKVRRFGPSTRTIDVATKNDTQTKSPEVGEVTRERDLLC